jgi:hypothetical protein
VFAQVVVNAPKTVWRMLEAGESYGLAAQKMCKMRRVHAEA